MATSRSSARRSSSPSEEPETEATSEETPRVRDDVLSASYHEIFEENNEDEEEERRTPVDPSFLTAKFVADTEKYGVSGIKNDDEDELSTPNLALLTSLESDARKLAGSLDMMIESISGSLHSISSLTADTIDVYRDAVCDTCDGMDANVKTMYQLMARVEEINKAMAPIHNMAEELNSIKKTLDSIDLNQL